MATASALDSDIDPANLGKGDWIWQVPTCISALGLGSVQGLIDFEKSRGMRWITVKCGDGGSVWSQFNSDLVTRAHGAGLKIFGWAYAYGNNVQGEINVALNALGLGADGFIIDAETEYEALANNNVAASNYCSAIKASYPTRFLAHAPYPIISLHSGFPYVMFGKFCDAVMPQAYWADIGGTNYAVTMVARMNSEWRAWQNGLTGANTNAIKPIIPIGQGYNSVNGTVTGLQISNFLNALKTNTTVVTPGGYKGVSFWSCQHHSPDMWNAIESIQIGDDPPAIVAQPSNRSVEQGSNITFVVSASGASPLRYQWRFNGLPISGATTTSISLPNAQASMAGVYDVIITNRFGAITSAVARLFVNPSMVWQVAWADDFETNSSGRWNLFDGSANGISDYAVFWAFNYATQLYTGNGMTGVIPAIQGSTGSRGLKLIVNKNDTNAALAGVSLYPKSSFFSGDHMLRCDMWLNYNGPAGGSAGSTEFASVGINHSGTRVNWGGGAASSSDGLWFAVDGEGGTTSDYRGYVGNASGAPTLLPFAASGLDANGAESADSLDSFFQGLFPAPTYESSGSPGKRWLECEVSQIGGMVTWRLNGAVVAQRSNTTSFASGSVMIGYMDLFSSIPSPLDQTFVIFDNVRVLVPIVPPSITAQPTNRIENAGADTTFAVLAGGSAPGYAWRFNGVKLAGATNASLTLTNLSAGNAGSYSAVITNAAGAVTSAPAILTVTTLRLLGLSASPQGWSLAVTGAPGSDYSLEASTNLQQWTYLKSFTNGGAPVLLAETNSPQMYFRVTAPR